MNKRKRMAVLKHRMHRKKLEEKRKALITATGLGTVVAKPRTEQLVATIQPVVDPVPIKKPVRKRKAEATAIVEPKNIEPPAEIAQPEIPSEPPKKRGRKKKTEATTDS